VKVQLDSTLNQSISYCIYPHKNIPAFSKYKEITIDDMVNLVSCVTNKEEISTWVNAQLSIVIHCNSKEDNTHSHRQI